MAVSTSYAPITVNWTTTNQSISVAWQFFSASDLVVTEVASTGVETVKTITTHYTVSGGTDANGLPAVGTVTMVGAATAGSQIRVTRSTPKTQTREFTEGGKLPAKQIEAGYDHAILVAQEGNAGGADGITGDVMQLNSGGAVDYWDGEGQALHDLAYVQLTEAAAPDTPASGYGVVYTKSDGQLYHKNDAGTEVSLTEAASDAEASATAAAASASAASTSETNAATSESNASTSETNASNSAAAAAASVAAANLPSSIAGQALKVLRVNAGETDYEFAAAGGDVIGPASSVDGEIALFDGTTGKPLKSATVTGLLKASSGVLDQADAGTDYLAPGEVTSVAPLSVGKAGEVSSETRVKLFSTLSSDSSTLYNTAMLYAVFDADSYPNGRLTFASPTDVDTWTDVLSVRGGNVGIGTTAPDTKFHLSGNMKLASCTLSGGLAGEPYPAGTQSSGTYTPDEANGNLQYAVNGGAHTLAPPTNNCTLVIQYTNNASAGTVTTSGFTLVTGAFTTVNGDDFLCQIIKLNGFSWLHIEAMQ
jgi:hypothetical protein